MRTYNITNAFVREGIAKGRIEGLEQGMEKGILKGMEKGILKGRVEGLEQGQAENQREIALRMLRKGLSIDLIHEYTELSGDEIRAFQKNAQENGKK